jgi:hypothetical protein
MNGLTRNGSVGRVALLLLAGCQGTRTTCGYEPLVGFQTLPAADADALCVSRATVAKRKVETDNWAQGGQPANHQTYARCMTSLDLKRVVVISFRYG